MRPEDLSLELLAAYPAFRRIRIGHFLSGKNPIATSNALTLLTVVILLACSAFDRSLYFKGSDIGLLEHPTIYAFLLGQWLFPRFIQQGLDKFLSMPTWGPPCITSKFLTTHFPEHKLRLVEGIRRETNLSKLTYQGLVAIGLVCWIWNSYQNQHPNTMLPFDFWDSTTFKCGYIFTRIYKLYLWCLFFPALAHALLILLFAFRRVFNSLEAGNDLILTPFHSDRCGGAHALISPVVRPLLPPLLISTLASLCAVSIHRRLDLTTGLGIMIVSVLFLLLYAIPASSLRGVIVKEKLRQMDEIATLQASLYKSLLEPGVGLEIAKSSQEVISSLDSLVLRISRVPNWPQFAFAVRAAGVASASPVVAWLATKAGEKLFLSFL